MKKELSLQQLINLKPTLETLQSNTVNSIIINNAIPKNHKGTVIDTEASYQKLTKIFEQLQIIKLAIQKANNNKKTSLGKTLQELIYEKSDLERLKTLLNTLFNQKFKSRVKGEQDTFNFTIPKSTLDDRLLEVEKRITEIKSEMTNFNQSTIVKIEIDEDLDLL